MIETINELIRQPEVFFLLGSSFLLFSVLTTYVPVKIYGICDAIYECGFVKLFWCPIVSLILFLLGIIYN